MKAISTLILFLREQNGQMKWGRLKALWKHLGSGQTDTGNSQMEEQNGAIKRWVEEHKTKREGAH